MPCIVSDVSDNRHLVKHGQTGFVYPVDQVQMLVEHLLCLVDDEELRRRMGRNGREHILAKFSVEAMLDNIESTYRELANIDDMSAEARLS